jgi:hypothetical protein
MSRWREMGSSAHIELGEGFVSDRKLALDHLLQVPYRGSA